MRRVAVVVALLAVLAGFAFSTRALLRAQAIVEYPAGWNLVSGPQNSHVRGATGLLYTLQPGDTDYETFPVVSPLRDGIGYWAYFPAGGSLDLAAGAPFYSIRLRQRQWIMVGNPSDTTTATISGDIEAAQLTRLAPGQGTFVLSPGLIIVAADTAAVTPTAPPAATPPPPCVGDQYAPGTAGTGCRPTGQTQPTARCYDGTFDYSRSTLACAGHGGVAYWNPCLPEECAAQPAVFTVQHTWVTSSFVGEQTHLYYCDDDSDVQNVVPANRVSYPTVAALLAVYPGRTLKRPCTDGAIGP